MPLTNYGQQQIVQNPFGKSGTQTVNPTSFYAGLITVDYVWAPSIAVTVGQYAISTAFNTTGRSIWKCTTAGTTGSGSDPLTATGAAGATVSDGTAVWTECTNLFYTTSGSSPNAFAGLEPIVGTNGYTRAQVTNDQTSHWGAPTLNTTNANTNGTVVTYNAALSYGASTGRWAATSHASSGWIVGYVLFDAAASASGNAWGWGLLNTYISVLSSGITVTIASGQLSVQLN